MRQRTALRSLPSARWRRGSLGGSCRTRILSLRPFDQLPVKPRPQDSHRTNARSGKSGCARCRGAVGSARFDKIAWTGTVRPLCSYSSTTIAAIVSARRRTRSTSSSVGIPISLDLPFHHLVEVAELVAPCGGRRVLRIGQERVQQHEPTNQPTTVLRPHGRRGRWLRRRAFLAHELQRPVRMGNRRDPD